MPSDAADIARRGVRHYHTIRRQYGLDAVATCALEGTKQVFLRGRVADPDNLRPQQNLFSYPPPRYCSGFGRANLPYHPVFYASDSPIGIGDELHVDVGSWLHLAVFYTPQPVAIEYLLLIHDAFSRDSKWADLRDELRQHVTKDSGGDAEQEWERLQIAAYQFRADDYQDTAAIGHFWLYERQIDALVYPSVKRDDTCNFALRTNFVDQHLILDRTFACRWSGHGLELHWTGIEHRGSIEWSESTAEDATEYSAGFSHLIG